MTSNDRDRKVAFIDEKIKAAYDSLKMGKYEQKQLLSNLDRAIADLKINPFYGTRIPSKLWPKDYIRKYNINNLWKYDLPNAWRLIYTVVGNKVEIISVILEWFSHKNYERKFQY